MSGLNLAAGSGAVSLSGGSFFGAKLALSGNDVTFIARGRHLAALREGGLRVESGTGAMHVANAHSTDSLDHLAPADVVMFCVKLWDVETAGERIKPLIRAGTAVIPLQNGQRPDTKTPPSTVRPVPRGAQTPAATPRPSPKSASRLEVGK